jgi:hypothetical protein
MVEIETNSHSIAFTPASDAFANFLDDAGGIGAQHKRVRL